MRKPNEKTLTIREVLAAFAEEHMAGVPERRRRQVEGVVDLIVASLDGYAYQYLDAAESARFDAAHRASGADHREFTEIFGPEYIAPNLREFLDYFLRRKVMASASFLKFAAETVATLSEWLAANGWSEPERAQETAKRGRQTGRDLVNAGKLARRLARWVEDTIEPADDANEGIFRVSRMARDRVWLKGTDGASCGPVRLPEDIVADLRVGWAVLGGIARRGRSWQLVEVWGVEPA